MVNKKYDPNMPSTGYDKVDYDALRKSTIINSLNGNEEMRFDSAEDASIFFARELDFIKAKAYDKIYPDMSALSHFPITSEVPAGAETFTYYSYEKIGMAKIISNYATDLPRADVKGTMSTGVVNSVGASYGYSVQEMRASRLAGKSLDVRKADSARYSIARKINTIAFAGDKEHNLMGMLTEGNNIPLWTLPENANHKTSWKEKSAAEILADINGMVAYQAKITQNVEHADTLALPPDVFIDISTRQIPNTGMTVKKFILDNAPYLKEIYAAAELSEVSKTTNPYNKNVALLYTNSEEKFSLEIPMPFYQYPVQPINLEIVVPCEERTGGIILYYPLSALITLGV